MRASIIQTMSDGVESQPNNDTVENIPLEADENIPLEAEHGKIQRIVKQNLLALQDQHAVGNRFVCYQ